MSVVKRMTAKEDFLQMPLKERNCEVELYEDCRTMKLMQECNCVPWELSGYQVMSSNALLLRHVYGKVGWKSTPAILVFAGYGEMQPRRQRLHRKELLSYF